MKLKDRLLKSLEEAQKELEDIPKWRIYKRKRAIRYIQYCEELLKRIKMGKYPNK